MKKYSESIEFYNNAIKINNGDLYCWYNKALTLRYLGRYEEAVKCRDKAIELLIKLRYRSNIEDVVYAIINYNKDVALRYLRRYEEAVKCRDNVIDYVEKSLDINLSTNMELAEKNGLPMERSSRILTILERRIKFLELGLRFSVVLANKAICLFDLGKYEESIRYFDQALDADQDSNRWFDEQFRKDAKIKVAD
jgi:tetratricopeptide (TPR) repeat protein